MQRICDFEIIANRRIAERVYEMKLTGDLSAVTAPGQFVNVKIDGLFLRRPISVCDADGDTLTLVYKTVGKGTEAMASMRAGEKLNLLTGLGNGYDLSAAGDSPLLVGGGVGVPPLYLLAKKLGGRCTVVLGFNRAEEAFYDDKFADLGAEVRVVTVDGSVGRKGFVTDAIEGEFSHWYACGPYPMLRALADRLKGIGGSVSLEERMGCGFGACMGCSVVTKNGVKRVCKEGPVFDAEEIIWRT